MTLYYQDNSVTLHHGDCLEVMQKIPDCSIDSIVTDPPYGLGFMGKAWDGLPPGLPWAQECLRVLKPGGHVLAFGGTRTWHRLASAVEDAGFEIRDSIAWLYGSGFPKSVDVAKAITGAQLGFGSNSGAIRRATMGSDYVESGRQGNRDGAGRRDTGMLDQALELAASALPWQGWGTALKPGFEPIVVARKPLAAKTVAANVLKHGTGALNIDASRVAHTEPIKTTTRTAPRYSGVMNGGKIGGGQSAIAGPDPTGRFPANVILDQHAAEALDEQSGSVGAHSVGKLNKDYSYTQRNQVPSDQPFTHGDKGGASRFFPTFHYEAKAPTSERPNVDGVQHPTVKPLSLMRWLVRLVTPPGGTVLEPFAGSGTTVEACIHERFKCVAIEREAEYLPLISARVRRARDELDSMLDFGVVL